MARMARIHADQKTDPSCLIREDPRHPRSIAFVRRQIMSRFVTVVLLSSALFALAPAVEPKQKVDDWPLFRRTAEQTGFTAAAAPEKLEEIWKFSTGDS